MSGEVVVDVYPQVFKTGNNLHSCFPDVKEGGSPRKSTNISFVFFTLMQRLLALHQASCLPHPVLI